MRVLIPAGAAVHDGAADAAVPRAESALHALVHRASDHSLQHLLREQRRVLRLLRPADATPGRTRTSPEVPVIEPHLDARGHLASQRAPVLLQRSLQRVDASPKPVAFPLRGATPQLQALAPRLELHALLPGASDLPAKRAHKPALAAHHEVRDAASGDPAGRFFKAAPKRRRERGRSAR